MLMEHETLKLKAQDDEYQTELRDWRAKLKPRKQKLEDDFAAQLEEQVTLSKPPILSNRTDSDSESVLSTKKRDTPTVSWRFAGLHFFAMDFYWFSSL